MHYLSMCIIVKDEGQALREWVAHHALLGVEHFYVFDNESQEPASETLRDFPQSLFSFFSVQGKEQQIPAYGRCLQEFGRSSRWMGFIDADEFLFPVQGRDLRPVLAEFEPYAGLAVPWTMFGSSGHVQRPTGTLMESYLHRFPDHATGWHHVIKCLVDPARVLGVCDPHRFKFTEGPPLVNDAHLPVGTDAKRVVRSGKRLQLNHYFFKSQEEWELKLARGRADRADEPGRYPPSLFEKQLEQATQLDQGILRFLPGLIKTLKHPGELRPAETGALPLSMALARCAAALERGALEEAHLPLCFAACHRPQDSELWILRAMLSRLAGQLELAHHFIRLALAREESPETYYELLRIAHARGDQCEARGAFLCLKDMLWRMSSDALTLWTNRVAEVERLVNAMPA